MDAITECEQLVRTQGRVESIAVAWRLFYCKELFTPWYNPSLDQVATELVYRQIVDHVLNDDYRLHPVSSAVLFVMPCPNRVKALSVDGRRLSVRLSVLCLTLSRERKGLSVSEQS